MKYVKSSQYPGVLEKRTNVPFDRSIWACQRSILQNSSKSGVRLAQDARAGSTRIDSLNADTLNRTLHGGFRRSVVLSVTLSVPRAMLTLSSPTCCSATQRSVSHFSKLSKSSPEPASPSPRVRIRVPPRAAKVASQSVGIRWYVEAQSRLPHPKTANLTPVRAWPSSDVSHSTKCAALSAGCPGCKSAPDKVRNGTQITFEGGRGNNYGSVSRQMSRC